MVKTLQRRNVTIGDVFQEFVSKTPEKPCLVMDDRAWTFREINELSNRIANAFHSHGYKKGDTVGLLLENRPEYVAIWLGLSKLGVITPLINNNLRQASLLHSITVANCNALIYGESYLDGEFIILLFNRWTDGMERLALNVESKVCVQSCWLTHLIFFYVAGINISLAFSC